MKKGLSSEEYIEELAKGVNVKGSNITWNELCRMAMEIRKFEIDLYWKRANYFWLFVAAFFIGYYQTIPVSGSKDTTVENFLFIIGGYLFSLGWFFVNRGSKYWQENWEKHIAVLSKKLNIPIFELLMSYKSGVWHLWKPYPYSVSRVNQILNFCIIVIWIILLFVRVYKTSLGCECTEFWLLLTLVGVSILTYMLHCFSRSFVLRHKTDHSKDFFSNVS